MATKRQKKEKAKRIIDDAVPTLPVPRFFPAPVRGLNLVARGVETLGQGLVEIDPLGIITDDQVMEAMVNEPSFKLSADQVDLINNDDRMVARVNGEMVEVPAAMVRRTIARGPGQFDRSRILPRSRTRKKTKTDKNMSKALREANNRLRTKNGKLRKGKTQADVMKLAHRLRRKM